MYSRSDHCYGHVSRAWEEFEFDATTLTAGNDPQVAASKIRESLRQQTDTFGIWNATATAQELGFGDASNSESGPSDDGVSEDADQDALFAEFLHNACEFCTVVSVILIDVFKLVDSELNA